MLELPNNLLLAFQRSGWQPNWKAVAGIPSQGIERLFRVPPIVREIWSHFGDVLLQPVDAKQPDLVIPAMWISCIIVDDDRCPENDTPYRAVKAHQNGPWFYLAMDGEFKTNLFMNAVGTVIRCDEMGEYRPGIPRRYEVSPFAASIEEAFEIIAFGPKRTAPNWLADAVAKALVKPCRFHFSPAVETMLCRGGWYPQRHIPTEVFVQRLKSHGYDLSQKALEVLETIGGMDVRIYKGDEIADSLFFEPLLAAQAPIEHFHVWERKWGDGPWSPLGTGIDGMYSFYLTASGRVIGSMGGDYVLVGNTFEEALENLLSGKEFVLLNPQT